MDKSLEAAYRATHFVVEDPRWSGEILVGELTLELDDFLRDQGFSDWAYITAYNPRSELLSDDVNQARHNDLIQMLDVDEIPWLSGVGRNPDGSWPADPSVLVWGIDRATAVKIGRTFGQNAIVCGTLGGQAELVACSISLNPRQYLKWFPLPAFGLTSQT